MLSIEFLTNVQDVLTLHENQPGGASVAVFPVVRPVRPKGGYIYSLKGFERSSAEKIGPGSVVRYIADHVAELRKEGRFLGWWTDNKTGRNYLDVSTHEDDIFRAVVKGIHHEQKAIFDVARVDDIRLPLVDRSTFTNDREYHLTVASQAREVVTNYLTR